MRILNLGAGVQSTTLALMAETGEIPKYDYAIFADVQAEPKSVYTHLEWLKSQLSYPVIVRSRGSLIENKSMRCNQGMRDQLWLHRYCKPLDQINFETDTKFAAGQTAFSFASECEGMCGV